MLGVISDYEEPFALVSSGVGRNRRLSILDAVPNNLPLPNPLDLVSPIVPNGLSSNDGLVPTVVPPGPLPPGAPPFPLSPLPPPPVPTSQLKFSANKWFTVKMKIRLNNHPLSNDGEMEVLLNEIEVLKKEKLKFRQHKYQKISSFFFNVQMNLGYEFAGAETADQFVDFKNFIISEY